MRNIRFPVIAILILMMASLIISASLNNAKAASTLIVDAGGSGDFTTIQAAVDAASSGDTIEVLNGVYSEKVVVEKDYLTIQGESRILTILQGGFVLQCDYSSIIGFRIEGMSHLNPDDASLDGIELIAASYNLIKDNSITDCYHGLWFEYMQYIEPPWRVPESCKYNEIVGNDLVGNHNGVMFNLGETNNRFYHNNFAATSPYGAGDVDYVVPYNEIWDNGYPDGGNYWNVYKGPDLMSGPNQDQPGSDGIIDIPYDVTAQYGGELGPNIDHYPLVNPWPGGMVIDTTPPVTSLANGDPKLVSDRIYVTADTPFTLTPTDAGSEIESTGYEITGSTGYSSGWLTYQEPFKLTMLPDGDQTTLPDGYYTISFSSTDKGGNVESTNHAEVTLFSWDSVFNDSHGRDTTLKVNTAYKLFEFIAPSNDYGIEQDPSMQSHGSTMIIDYRDSLMKLKAIIVNARVEKCNAVAKDEQTGETYLLVQ